MGCKIQEVVLQRSWVVRFIDSWVVSFIEPTAQKSMSFTNQKSMNFTTQKIMNLTTQKSMKLTTQKRHYEPHKPKINEPYGQKNCLNCLGAIYINLLEVFCFSGFSRVFSQKTHMHV